jgi:DNA-binding phage protein
MELVKKGVSIKRLADDTGISYHYFYKMLVEQSMPVFKTQKMKDKANAFLAREDVKEILKMKNKLYERETN